MIVLKSFHLLRLTSCALAVVALTLITACDTAEPAAAPPTEVPSSPSSDAAPAPTTAVVQATAAPAAATVAPTAMPQPAAADAGPVEAKVERLVIAFTQPTHETNIPWFGARTMLSQFNPVQETLIDLHPETGEFASNLATDWSMSADGKAWTLDLREGVPFHFDFGEFTAEVVAHTRALMGQ